MNDAKKELKCLLRNMESYFLAFAGEEISLGKFCEIISNEVLNHRRKIVSKVDKVDLYLHNNKVCEMDKCHGHEIYFEVFTGKFSGEQVEKYDRKRLARIFIPRFKEVYFEMSKRDIR